MKRHLARRSIYVTAMTMVLGLVIAGTASAAAREGTYSGTDSRGEPVSVRVVPGGSYPLGVLDFRVAYFPASEECDNWFLGATWLPPLKINNNSFSITQTNSEGIAFSARGTFNGAQASGTYRVSKGACSSGDIAWSGANPKKPKGKKCKQGKKSVAAASKKKCKK